MNKNIKLPSDFMKDDFSWTQWLTFKCNFACSYCIMSHRDAIGGATKWKPKELTGEEIVDFWNSLPHTARGKKLGLIGGEPTLHKDFSYIIQNLKEYLLTITTNCGSRFFKQKDFVEKLRTHPSSDLRINTSFHPRFATPQQYLEIVAQMQDAGLFIDQTSYVYTPESESKYFDEIVAVDQGLKEMGFKGAYPELFLGFWNEEDGFKAEMTPTNIWPRGPEDIVHYQLKKTGLYDIEVYKKATSMPEKSKVKNCPFAFQKMLVDPQGYIYACHYKLYHGIDPLSHIYDFKLPTIENATCRHYGFCLPCNYPANKELSPNEPVVVNTFYNEEIFERNEVKHLKKELEAIAHDDVKKYDSQILFEASMVYLYSAHRHFGEVLYFGDPDNAFLKYLKDKKYSINMGASGLERLKKKGKKADLVLVSNNSELFVNKDDSLLESIKMLRSGGMIAATFNLGVEELYESIINPALAQGFVLQGGVDYSNLDNTYGAVCLRRTTL